MSVIGWSPSIKALPLSARPSTQIPKDVHHFASRDLAVKAAAVIGLTLHAIGRCGQRISRRAKVKDTSIGRCDYLVVGAGASGMSFVDTLLKHHPARDELSVVIVDKHGQPGGHWNDSYGFVKLHQSASNYGVESTKLEEQVSHPELQASRDEILSYYSGVMDRFVEQSNVHFVPNATFDFDAATITETINDDVWNADAGTVVDARFTEPDIPANTKPRFEYNPTCLHVVAPNALSLPETLREHICVIGGGKTGQDTVLYLQEKVGVAPADISWVVPHDPWITARKPPMDTCMEFLQTCLQSPSASASSADFVQHGFLKLERQGKVYRIDPAITPTKFMNATLNADEVEVLRRVSKNIIRDGQISKILDSGELEFIDGHRVGLPWEEAASTTTYVHCSAGAFNFSKSAGEDRPAVFQPGKITVQEIFSYPGFCFNGSLIAKLECEDLSIDDKNVMCELPPPQPPAELLPAEGNIGPLHHGHGLLVALRNLRRWYGHPGIGEWLHQLRLFSLTMNGYSLEEGKAMVESSWSKLVTAGLIDPQRN